MKSEPNPVPKVNVLSRMAHVWTNTAFIKTVLYPEQDKAVGRTWFFWFVWNTLVAVVLASLLWFVWAQNGVKWIENEWWPTVPDFEMQVTDGILSTNLAEPYVFYDDEGGLVVIDTQGLEYTEESLKDYQGGLVVSAEKFTAKEETGEFRSFYFSEFEEDFVITKADVTEGWFEFKPNLILWGSVIGFMIIWFWLCVLRLISAVWWALVFWGLGNMAGVPQWTFPRSYLSVLNFYFIPLTFEIVLVLIGVGMIPFSTLLVFGLVFGLNFYAFKNTPIVDETVQPN